MTKLKVAVVGLTFGASHVADYVQSPYVNEVVICDTDATRLNSVGDTHGISKRYSSYEEMLEVEKPNAVSVAVPNYLHAPFSIKAMEAGAHVLCEKPMAVNAAEAITMQQVSEKTDKKLMIHFNQRFEPEALALKALIDAEELGRIYFARTTYHRLRGVPWWYPIAGGKATCAGGAMLDIGVHMLDRAMWLLGFPTPEWVLGNTFSELCHEDAAERGIANFELEDMAVAMIRMKGGTMLEIEASWAANRENTEIATIQLYGTRGGALIEVQMHPHYVGTHKVFLTKDGKVNEMPLDTKPFQANIRNAFLEAVINNNPVPCTPKQGVIVNRIIDGIYESARLGQPVKL